MSLFRRTSLPVLALSALLFPQNAHAQEREAPELEPGVAVRIYDIGVDMSELPTLLDGQLPNVHEVRNNINYSSDEFAGYEDRFLVHVDGVLRITRPGDYTFRLTSDDGAVLMIDGETVINHDGVHPPTAKDARIDLAAGDHTLSIRMFEQAGGQELHLIWRMPCAELFAPIPAAVLFTEALDERPTAEGRKRVRIEGVAVRPGTGEPLDRVHPSWTIENLMPDDLNLRCGAAAVLPNGHLAVTEFTPANNGVFRDRFNGRVLILKNIVGNENVDTANIEAVTIDEALHDPCGALWHDGALYVCDREALYKYTDEDGDGVPEKRTTFASGWVSDNYHHFTFGIAHHDGHFYLGLSTSIYFNNQIRDDNVVGRIPGLNGPNPETRGCMVKIDDTTGEVEYTAGGFRTPNGVGVGPEGILLVSDNQGAWNPANSLYHVRPGHFYGHYNNTEASSDFYPDGGVPSLFSENEPTPPAVYLPQGECSNSPTNPVMIEDGAFAGQMYLGELTGGGIRRVQLEQVNGVWQGAVFRHSQGFSAGNQRILWGPDGCLYAAQMGSGGNWSWKGRQFGLQRLRPTGETAFEIHSITATPDGFTVRFTEPVPQDQLEDLSNYTMKMWTYTPTENYGGPKVGPQRLHVEQATASEDRLSVRLFVRGVEPNHVVHLQTPVTNDAGEDLWSGEAWYTFHQRPLPDDGGTQSLFDGETLDGWHAKPGGEWTVEDGVIVGRSTASERRHGLLVSDETYTDFIVAFDYQVLEGDSGFYFRSEERDDTVGIAGFQVEVDNVEPGGLYETSGRAWVIKPSPEQALRWQRPGDWNHVRLTCVGDFVKVEVNGITTAQHTDPAGRTEGHFALQLHGSQDMHVRYRDINLLRPNRYGWGHIYRR
ncbi:MAG: family 16 glycoside hydrolase [Planctomycetota bacterium]